MSGIDLAEERERARVLVDAFAGSEHEDAHAAILALNASVAGWITGLEKEARALSRRARGWLEHAADGVRRARALGVACWMDDIPAQRWFREAVLAGRWDEDHVRDCCLAAEYASGVVAYERVLGPAPTCADEVHTPAELAAWVCAAQGRVERDVWVACGERVIAGPLADWISHGHGVQAAAWLELALPGASAAEVFRRARELLEHDCPHPLADVLLDSLGDPIDVELFGGFLAAVGAARARDDGPALIVASFDDRMPLVVPVAPAALTGGLDDAVRAALEAEPAGLPEVLDAIAAAARGRIVDGDGERLALRSIAVRERGGDDWRDRMAGLVVAGQLRLGELAPVMADAEIPPTSAGLRDEDRRALMALRDMVATRVLGRPFERPTHPDPAVAAARAALLRDLEALLDGGAFPRPDSPAYVLTAILDPDAVRAAGAVPPEWRRWL
jgi:hypothetical protein